jgi:hypothetical protein
MRKRVDRPIGSLSSSLGLTKRTSVDSWSPTASWPPTRRLWLDLQPAGHLVDGQELLGHVAKHSQRRTTKVWQRMARARHEWGRA